MNNFHRQKTTIVIFFLLFVSGLLLVSCAPAKPLHGQTSAMIESGSNITTLCTQTVFAYAHSRDAVDLEANGALFTQNATLSLGPTKFNGRDEIVAGLADRGPKEFTRHVIASVSIDRGDDETVTGRSYALVYVSTPREDDGIPVTLATISPKVLLTYKDTFDVTENNCLISERVVSLDMVANNEK